MGMAPYLNREQDRADLLGPAGEAARPQDYIAIPNAYTAAVTFLTDRYGRDVARLFEHVAAESYKGKIKDEHLPEIADKMIKRGSLFGDKIADLKSMLTQLKNARLGEGDPVNGFLKSLGGYHG
jgi:hypothetical protein